MLLTEIQKVTSFEEEKEKRDEQKRWKRYHELGIVPSAQVPKTKKKKE